MLCRNGVLLLAGVLMAGCSASGAFGAVYISGRVLDKATGQALSAAVVTIQPKAPSPDASDETQSLLNGSYVVKAPAAGSYRLTVSRPGYFSWQKDVQVSDAGIPAMSLSLKPRPSIQIHLLRGDGAAIGVEPTEVTMTVSGDYSADPASPQLKDEPVFLQPRSSADGRLTLIPAIDPFPRTLTGVDILVRVAAAGYGRVHLTEWPQQPLILRLTPGVTLRGATVDQDGKPLGYVLLIAYQQPDDSSSQVPLMTVGFIGDRDGHFELPALVPGRYSVRLCAAGEKRPLAVSITSGVKDITLKPDNE